MFVSLVPIRKALAMHASKVDVASLSAGDAVRALEELGEILRLVDGMSAQYAKRVHATDGHLRRGHRNVSSFVAQTLGISSGEANVAIKTAEQLEGLPATAEAVRDGRLSGWDAQMIARAATINPAKEHELLAAAKLGRTPLKDACIKAWAEVEDPEERAKRQRAAQSFRHWVDADGMARGAYRMPLEQGAAIGKKIDAEVERIFREHKNGEHEPHEAYAADALETFVLAEGSQKTSRSKYRVHVLIDHDALVRGNALPGETCEIAGVGPVNAQWVRDLLGTAFATAIIKNGKDIRTVADVGRYRPAEIETALAVDGLECEIVGCYCRGYLEIDHHHDFAKGGPTTFENLGPKCSRHHDLKSKGWIEGPADPNTGKRTLRPPPGWNR